MGLVMVNCIHDDARTDRLELLRNEMEEQRLAIRYWPAIKDPVMGFRGISQAHKQIVTWAMLNQLPEVCIMEDDCFFFAPGAFDYFLRQKPDSYDLYLGNVFSGLNPDKITTSDFCGLTLYFCHSRFYATFLSMRENNHLDRELTGKGEYFVCHPMVCSQQPGWSDNKKYYDSYDRYLQGYDLFGR